MHGISLLAHEAVDVVVDQCRNFETFAPHSTIMVHVSASANFTRAELEEALAQAGCSRSLVNPVSMPSRWGSIIAGHFANIRALCDLLQPAAHVALHASNDMLLRPLPQDEGTHGTRFEQRAIDRQGCWFTGRSFARSAVFTELLKHLGCAHAIGSQIEGSAYPLTILADLAERLAGHDDLIARLPAVAEEVIFPTWALERTGPTDRLPTILFRPPLLTGLGAALLPRFARGWALADLSQKAFNRLHQSIVSPNARPADVEAVIAGEQIALPDWANDAPAAGPRPFWGIKRIARAYDDPLRTRIRRHTLRFAMGEFGAGNQ